MYMGKTRYTMLYDANDKELGIFINWSQAKWDKSKATFEHWFGGTPVKTSDVTYQSFDDMMSDIRRPGKMLPWHNGSRGSRPS